MADPAARLGYRKRLSNYHITQASPTEHHLKNPGARIFYHNFLAPTRERKKKIQNWLTVLKNDKRFIVSTTGKAEKAVAVIPETAA